MNSSNTPFLELFETFEKKKRNQKPQSNDSVILTDHIPRKTRRYWRNFSKNLSKRSFTVYYDFE